MAVLRVRGARLHHAARGRGEPLLVLSGFALSAVVFDPVLPLYTERFRVLTADPRGAGRSRARSPLTSVPQLAGDAVALLDGLDVPSAHVYGVSMGGMVAQELALRFPERVRGLVLGGTTPGGPRAPLPLRELAGLAGAVGGTPRGVRERVLAAALFSRAFREEQPERVAELVALFGRHRTRARGVHAHWWASVYHDTWSRLPQLQAPTLVLHGEQDGLAPVASARALAARIPDAELALVPGAGHAYLLERPAASRDLLVDWLDRRGPIAPGAPRSGLAARTEPVTRALGLTTGALRTGRSAAAVLASGRARRRARAQPSRDASVSATTR